MRAAEAVTVGDVVHRMYLDPTQQSAAGVAAQAGLDQGLFADVSTEPFQIRLRNRRTITVNHPTFPPPKHQIHTVSSKKCAT